MAEHRDRTERTYHILGIPLRTGSLYPGNENDAQAYRDAQLLARLRAAGCRAVDDGDAAIPSYLPHHAIPPIRSWPGPRIAWDCVGSGSGPFCASRACPAADRLRLQLGGWNGSSAEERRRGRHSRSLRRW
jgi:hypothetical protein